MRTARFFSISSCLSVNLSSLSPSLLSLPFGFLFLFTSSFHLSSGSPFFLVHHCLHVIGAVGVRYFTNSGISGITKFDRFRCNLFMSFFMPVSATQVLLIMGVTNRWNLRCPDADFYGNFLVFRIIQLKLHPVSRHVQYCLITFFNRWKYQRTDTGSFFRYNRSWNLHFSCKCSSIIMCSSTLNAIMPWKPHHS